MAKSKKLFDREFRGYKKQQVVDYIGSMRKQYKEVLRSKNKELDEAIKDKEVLAWKHSQLQASYIELQEEKNRVADILINAENTANEIIEKAKTDAIKEKDNLDNQVDEKRMLIVDLNKSIRDMKLDISALAQTLEDNFREILSQVSERVEDERTYIYSKIDEMNKRLEAREEDLNEYEEAELIEEDIETVEEEEEFFEDDLDDDDLDEEIEDDEE